MLGKKIKNSSKREAAVLPWTEQMKPAFYRKKQEWTTAVYEVIACITWAFDMEFRNLNNTCHFSNRYFPLEMQ